MRLGLITDTHLPALIRQLDELGPQVAKFLAAVDLILHAGDVTSPAILDWLEQFAPVTAAKGNNDEFVDPRMASVQYLEVEGWSIGMAHNLAPESRPLREIRQRCFSRPIEVMIGGHTHLERIRCADGLVLINSGSPVLPHHKETRLGTVASLDLSADALHAEVLVLGETPGRPNPGRPHVLDVSRLSLRVPADPAL